jgi:hypothetical protein
MGKLTKYVVGLYAVLLFGSVHAEWPHENISNAVFAKNIQNREPTDIITGKVDSLGKIYFFTNIRSMNGDRITHRWSYKGRVMAEVSFDIRGDRWRVWSSKNLWHTWLGVWTVDVLNHQSKVLLTRTFEFESKDE